MPKLWNETIEAHRNQVRESILDAMATLMREHDRRSVTMSHIAEQAGIGRATLYKYFPDIEAILHAWHARQITRHLSQLAEVRDRGADPGSRLEAVLHAYALLTQQSRGHHDIELVALLHRDEHLAQAQQQLQEMIRGLIADAVRDGELSHDVAPDELALYCLNALNAAASLPSRAAVHRLVRTTLNGMRCSP